MKNFRTYQTAKDQFQRTLLSICLNLAEGSGKSTCRDRAKFYAIALGSIREVQALLDLHGYKEAYDKADRLAAMTFCLLRNPGSAPGYP